MNKIHTPKQPKHNPQRPLIAVFRSCGRLQPGSTTAGARPPRQGSPIRKLSTALPLLIAAALPGTARAGYASIEIPYQTNKRGHLDPGRIRLATRYPFGLFYAWSYPHPPFSCLIYPKPIPSPLPPSTPMHDHGMHQGESGQEDFTGLRQWQTNDSPKHIAWKAVARDIEHRPLLVKQFAGGAAEELLLDWALSPEGADMETRLSILTGWVLAAEQQHLHYGMRLPGKTFAPALGTAHRNSCLEALALYA